VFEKMQSEGIIPMTDLGILKIKQEAQEANATNEIQVKTIKPLGPVDKEVVPFEVAGVEIDKVQGKPDVTKPFTCTIKCKLTDQMAGYPLAIEITGLATPPVKPPPKPEEQPKPKKKRRHH